MPCPQGGVWGSAWVAAAAPRALPPPHARSRLRGLPPIPTGHSWFRFGSPAQRDPPLPRPGNGGEAEGAGAGAKRPKWARLPHPVAGSEHCRVWGSVYAWACGCRPSCPHLLLSARLLQSWWTPRNPAGSLCSFGTQQPPLTHDVAPPQVIFLRCHLLPLLPPFIPTSVLIRGDSQEFRKEIHC